MRRATLFFGLLVVLIFAPFFFKGEVFVPGDFSSFVYPWRAYESNFPHNIELFDVPVFFYPQDVFFSESLKRGEFPLWNPNIFAGHPIVASGQSGFLYPPRYLFHQVFSPGVAKTWIQILHLFGAGLAMTWFFRQRGFQSDPSLLGGLIWMGNGFVLSWLEFEHVAVASFYLPLLLVAMEKGLAGARHWWFVVPLFGALSLHSGHLQVNLYIGLIALLYALFRLYESNRREQWIYFGCAGLLTVGLAAPTIFPFFELLANSQRAPLSPSANATTLPMLLLSLFSPDIWGNPSRGFLINQSQANLIYPEFACFVGIVPLVLAMLARGLKAKILGVVAALSLIVASASFGFTLPLLNRFIPGRALHVTIFCLMFLAVLGAKELQNSEQARALARRWAAVLGGVWVAVLGALAYLNAKPEIIVEWWQVQPERIKLPPLGGEAAGLIEAFRDAYQWNPQLLFPLLGAAVVIAWPGRLRLAIAVTALQIVLFGASFNTSVDPSTLLKVTPEIEALQGPGRTLAIGSANYNILTPYGVSLITGYESLVPRLYYSALNQADPGKPLPMRSLALSHPEGPMVTALGVRYVLVPPTKEIDSEQFELSYEGIGGKVYENRKALGRAYLIGEVHPFLNPMQLIDFDPVNTAFVESLPRVALTPSEGTIEWEFEGANRLELSVVTETDQLLVLSDSFYPGWRVWVDGEPEEIIRVNLASRGVYLKPGRHHLEFRFQPNSFRLGLAAAGLSLFLVVIGIAWGFQDSRARCKKVDP